MKIASRILFIEIVNTLKNTKNRPNQPNMIAIDNKLEPKSRCNKFCIPNELYMLIKKFMQNFLQRDLGSSLLSIAIILGWLGLFFVFLRILTISIKRILESILKK